jgi:alkylation response protein AidB-like acyl-CoA dehydrogenase
VTSSLDSFRHEVRLWLDKNCPVSLRGGAEGDMTSEETEIPWGGRNMADEKSDRRTWMDRMAAQGWTAPTWPKEYGGGGLSREEAAILTEEMRRIQAKQPLFSFGISMLGPVLLEFGTEEQKREHLPKIVRGDIRWCQGYSEPDYGSDLAGLQTRAVRQGDEFIVNGQKIWTSYADESDWIFCLVRTDPKAKKQDGISFLLFDMQSPGVTVSPIQLISGSSPFSQVFFEDVKVPAHQLVPPYNGGWTIAKRLLQHERNMISGIGGAGTGRGQSLVDFAREQMGSTPDGQLADPALRDLIARQEMDRLAFGLTTRRAAHAVQAGVQSGHLASMFKYYGTELNKRKYEVMISAAGTQGLAWEAGAGYSEEETEITREWLRSKGNSIEGGTSEIQLNVIAKRVLGLPD